MPVFVIVAAMLGDYAFVLGRTAIIFYAIRLGADTSTILLCGGAEGLVYALTAGRLAGPLVERFGSRRIMRLTAATLGGLFLIAPLLQQPGAIVVLFAVLAFPLSLFWPSVHARLAERTDPALVPRVQAVFNVAWSVAILLAFATCGWLFEAGYAAGLGPWIALCTAAACTAAVVVLPLPTGKIEHAHLDTGWGDRSAAGSGIALSDAGRRLFGVAGWLGNFGAFAVYDAVRLVFPSLAAQLGFGEGRIGSLIAVALLAQAVTFGLTMRWKGWLYRRRWLYGACVLQLAALALFMVAERGAVFAAGFVMVGAALAATYAASLFYSLGATHTAGHAGGRHEAMIGAARVAGPVLGAAAARITGSSRAPFVMYALVIIVLIGIYFMLFRRLSEEDRAAIDGRTSS